MADDSNRVRDGRPSSSVRERRPPTPGRLPDGRLVRSRVVTDLASALGDALDRRLDGYAVLEPQDALLLDADAAAVVAFRGGVPVGAYHAGTDRGGPAALADLAVAGPCRVELRATERHRGDTDPLGAFDRDRNRVEAAVPAERLAGDTALAARTREVSDDRRSVGSRDDAQTAARRDDSHTTLTGEVSDADPGPVGSAGDRSNDGESPDSRPTDPVVAFLEDDEKVDAIRERAREQACERAEEWGLSDQLADVGDD